MVPSGTRSATRGIFFHFLDRLWFTSCRGKAIEDGALQRTGGDGSGDLDVRFKEMQKEPVLAQELPFGKAELGNKFLVAAFKRPTQMGTTKS